jgi:hypothetical protein
MDERSFQREPDGTWSTGANLDGSGERTKITLRRQSGAATKLHLAAALDVLHRWQEFQKALEPALFAFYCRMSTIATESGPSISSPAEVWGNVELSEIEVFADEHGKPEYVQGFGRCSWEQDHGLEVVVRGNGEPIYVGSYEGWNHASPPTDQDWNFANPSTQESAVSEWLSESEIAKQVSSLPPEDREPPVKAHEKPWWKLW